MIRRLLQSGGAEVVHLGHNRSVADIVRAAIAEDADAIAVSSYQGGHNEYFRYMIDMLRELGAAHIRVVVGGGGTISPAEIAELEAYGVAKIYTPEDGRRLGLTGMIDDVFARVGRRTQSPRCRQLPGRARSRRHRAGHHPARRRWRRPMARCRRSAPPAERAQSPVRSVRRSSDSPAPAARGKSSLTDELLQRFLRQFPGPPAWRWSPSIPRAAVPAAPC